MILRQKILTQIKKIESLIQVQTDPSIETLKKTSYSEKIENYYNNFVEKNEKTEEKVNKLYSLSNNSSKNLTKDDCRAYDIFIQKLIIDQAKINTYDLKLSEYFEVPKKKKNHQKYTVTLNKIMDLVYIAQQAMFEAFDSAEMKISYKVNWPIGRKILSLILDYPEYQGLDKAFLEDLRDKRNIFKLMENITLNTPPTEAPEEFYISFKNTLDIVKYKDIMHLVIILSLNRLVEELFLQSDKENDDSPLFGDKTIINIYKIVSSQTETKHPESVFLREIKIKCKDIINFYGNTIGLEVMEFFLEKKIVIKVLTKTDKGVGKKGKEDKDTKEVYHYFLTNNIAKACITHRLPYSYLPKFEENGQEIIFGEKDRPYVGYTKFNRTIEKDDMQCQILDWKTWYGASGLLSLNLKFISEFLEIFSRLINNDDIFEGQKINICDEEMFFLNAFYRVNFLALRGEDHMMITEMFRYALDFKDLKLKEFYNQPPFLRDQKSFDYNMDKLNINQTDLRPDNQRHKRVVKEDIIKQEFLDKIYHQKHLFIYLLRNLEILIYTESFQIHNVFDQRGRAYPESSLMNHLQPLFKYFFAWQNEIPREESKRNKIRDLILNKVYSFDIQQENIVEIFQSGRTLLTLCKRNFGTQLFELYLLISDYANLALKNYEGTLQRYYTIDASSSGFQIIAMLLRERTLALACGIISPTPVNDVYTIFVSYFFDRMKELKRYSDEFYETFSHIVEDKRIKTAIEDKSIDKILANPITKNHEHICEVISANFITYGPAVCVEAFRNKFQEKALEPIISEKIFRSWVKDYGEEKEVRLMDKMAFNFGRDKNKLEEMLFKKGYVKDYINLLSVIYELSVLRQSESHFKYVNRKLVKHGIMTLFYGSSNLTRRRNYQEKFTSQLIQEGRIATGEDVNSFFNLAKYIDHLLLFWVKEFYPGALILKKVFTKINNISKKDKKSFHPLWMSNKHCKWYYSPMITRSFTKARRSISYRLRISTLELDRKKLKAALLANIIQFCDANICAKIVKIMKEKGLPILTVHDCFKTPYEYENDLNGAVFKAYQEFYDEDTLNTIFASTQPFILEEIEKQKKEHNLTESFTSNELTKINLFKI